MTGARPPVLLTGASGFIGRHLVSHLTARGHAVRALLRPASAGRRDLGGAVRIVVGELDDRQALRQALDGVGAVVYGAGSVRGRVLDDFRAANVTGVAAMAAALQELPDPVPLVLLSSLAASRPELSHYAASKAEGEAVLRGAGDLTWVMLRPPAVYGPGDKEMLPLLKLVRRGLALRPGPVGQRLSLLYVTDLARAVTAALDHLPRCRQGCFSLDDGRPGGYTWGDIGAAAGSGRVREVAVPGGLLRAAAALNLALAGRLGYLPMLSPGKVRELQQDAWLCDNSAFTDATDWHPEVDLARGARLLFAS